MKGTVRSSERRGVLPNSHGTDSTARPSAIRHARDQDCHGRASARAEAARRNAVSAARLSSMRQS